MSIYHFHNPRRGMKDDEGNEIEVNFDDIGAAYIRRTLFHNLRHNTVMLPTSIYDQSFSSGLVLTEPVTMQEFGFSHPVLLDFNLPLERTMVDPAAVQKAVEEAIIKERTQKIRAVGTKPNTPLGTGRTGMGGMGGSGMGGSGMGMSGYDTNAISTTMGSGSMGSYVSRENTLIALAGNPQGGTGPNSGMNQATNVLNMLKYQLKDDEKLDVRKFEAVVQFVWFPKTPTERAEAKTEKLKALAEAEAAMSSDEETETGGVGTVGGDSLGGASVDSITVNSASVDGTPAGNGAGAVQPDVEPTETDETPEQ